MVSATRTPDGWAWGSCLVAGATTPVPWTTARRVVDTFVAEARAVTVRMVVDAGWTPEEARAASARVLGAMGPSD
ncbi:MAG: hypothetical protein IR158_12970 [Cellulomonas sp.]|uniref:hypothetical protein n=1 Tax=Cellulomonas sp. TaxID=40001 RepID=UPI0019D95DFA|nr:hypothetical protein [Cellulomonas sp.]MBF0688661.1 hypothetical protein [Cellulomonas sp.]